MKAIVKTFVKQEPRRKDSFWFDGEVASVKLGKVLVSVMATGTIRVVFNPDEDMFNDQMATKEARSRGYTDRKLKNLSNHDGWSNNNWFGYIVQIDGEKEYKWNDQTDINLDDAIFAAKQIAEEELKNLNKS